VTTNTPTTGLDLKVARVQHRLKAWQIAEAMGVSGSRVSAIEREAVVSEQMAGRYLAAVRTCSTNGTNGRGL
jgi:DNA-binding transcriptional regulator YiaG